MRKHNQIHTLGTPHYKAHFRFEDFKCALWSKKCGNFPDFFAGNHLLTAHAKTCEEMLRHRAVYVESCGVVWVLRTTWYNRRAAHPKEEYREFALINQRQATCKIHRSISCLNSSAPGRFRDFQKEKRLNACGFAREFLWSGMLHRPGKSLKRRGKSCSLHSKTNFLLGDAFFLWVMS